MKLEEVNTRTKEAVDFLVAALESGHSEVLTAYLGAMAKFRTYSFGNIMLIARQKPDATNVAGLRTWNSLGRFVKRGEKGIFILAPMVGRRSTKDVATDERSEDATTEGQRTLYGFRAVYVFDVSQTEGKELPTLTEVNGDVSGYRERLFKFVESQSVEISFSERIAPAKGLSYGGKITLLSGMQPAEEFSTLVHDRSRNVASGRPPHTDHQASPRNRGRSRGLCSLPIGRTTKRDCIPGLHPALARRRQSPSRELGSRSTNRCRDPRGHCPRASGTRGSRITSQTPAPFGFHARRVRPVHQHLTKDTSRGEKTMHTT